MLTPSSSAIIVPHRVDAPPIPAIAPVKREAASRFLHLLDPKASGFTFQTFDDDRSNGHGPNGMLARATADRNEVLQLYESGAGVFVTINETDLAGRKSENIQRIRAIWQEDDSGHDGPFPLEPSLVVETSPGQFHRYWLVADDWPADDRGRADFATVMERMVGSYGSDKNAKDISRVLRVPGFLHRKDPSHPHMVHIIADGGRRYTREQILQAFPKVGREPQRHSEWRAADSDEERIADALRAIPAHDRDIWLQIGMALKSELGDSGRGLWDNWAATCRDKFNNRDQDKTWRSFRRNGIGIGTLYHNAQRHGWSPPRREPRKSPQPKTDNGAIPQRAEISGPAQTAHDWNEPDPSILDDRRGDLPEFPLHMLSPKLQALIRRTAKGAGVTPAHVAVPMLGIISSLIGMSRRIETTASWRQPMTCWTTVVGFSGTGKTPGLNVTKRCVKQIERDNKTRDDDKRRAYETRKESATAAREKWKKAVKDAIENNVPPPPMPIEATDPGKYIPAKLSVSDGTIERLGETSAWARHPVPAGRIQRLVHQYVALHCRAAQRTSNICSSASSAACNPTSW